MRANNQASGFVRNFEKINKPQIQKYKKYIKDNDWTTPILKRDSNGRIESSKYYFIKDVKFGKEVMHDGKEPEYKVQQKIVSTITDRLKYFAENVEADIGKNDRVNRMIKSMRSLIEIHLNRIGEYISSNSVLIDKEEVDNDDKKTQKDFKSEEIEFDAVLYKDLASVTDKIKKLNLERDNDDSILNLYDNMKAPLSMREEIEEAFPDVKRKVESMKLNFTSPPKNEMLITMNEEDIPVWNEDKHYFEQDKKTLQFYIDEYKKIKNGIVIDGVYITGWLYCHINVFKTAIPTSIFNKNSGEYEIKDIDTNPPLRDNEWFIIQDSYEQARKDGDMLFLCATRRAAKTTSIASHLFHKALSGGRELVVAGGSAKDLGQIEKNFRRTVEKAHPAFYIPNTTNDWTKKVRLGVRKKNNNVIDKCTLNIVNLNSGGERSSELLAGFTPDALVIDECMKNPFKDQLNAAKPALDSPEGKRCVAILSGTGNSDEAVTKDAFIMLQDPAKEEVHNMNWEALERNIPKEYITWNRRKFGSFLPAQMSAKEGMVKIDSNLAEYLGVESEALSKIKIKVTNWKRAKEIIERDREIKRGDRKSYTKEIVYYPIDPEEIFLSGKPNPFPQERLKKYRLELEASGDYGKKVLLDRDDKGGVTYQMSNREYPDYPYKGGFHNSPVTIYEDPIKNAPFEFYVAGHDGYKQDESDSDSLGSFVIIRRDTGALVASYHSRPDPRSEFNIQGLLLLEMYNSPVFMENEDMDFKTHTDRQGVTEDFLAKGGDLLGDLSLHSNERRKFGWQPTSKNKSFFLGIFINLMQEVDDEGDEIVYGFKRIKDLRIIDEMINFKEGGNYDAITACMGAYAYDYYLQTIYGAPKKPLTDEEIEERNRKKQMVSRKKYKRSPYPNTRRRRNR